MAEVLLALVLSMALFVLAAVGSLATVVWWLHRRNRVHPRRRTGAPLLWLASPAPVARTHRQLRGAVRLTLITDMPPSLRPQAADLHDQAVLLDRELVHAARLPRPDRRSQLRGLQGRAVVVERTAVQLAALARNPVPATVAPAPDELAELAERVGLLGQARDELARLTSPRLPAGSPWARGSGPAETARPWGSMPDRA